MVRAYGRTVYEPDPILGLQVRQLPVCGCDRLCLQFVSEYCVLAGCIDNWRLLAVASQPLSGSISMVVRAFSSSNLSLAIMLYELVKPLGAMLLLGLFRPV